jgi:hypothetical protein
MDEQASAMCRSLLPSRVIRCHKLHLPSERFSTASFNQHLKHHDQFIVKHRALQSENCHRITIQNCQNSAINNSFQTSAMQVLIRYLLILPCVQFACANLIRTNALIFQRPEPTTFVKLLNGRSPDFPAAPSTTPAAQLLISNSACEVVGQALAICQSLSPGLTTMQPTAQAQCLCYSSTSWAPGYFDSAVQSCADYASTVVPEAYTPLANLEGFCSSVGDVNSGLSFIRMTMMPSSAATTYAPLGSNSSNMGGSAACNAVNSAINLCTSLTPGFMRLQSTDQAKCLCYSLSSWAPSVFDGAVSTCCPYANTADTTLYSTISTLSGFCGSVGNVMSTAGLGSYSIGSMTASPAGSMTGGPSATSSSGAGASTTSSGANLRPGTGSSSLIATASGGGTQQTPADGNTITTAITDDNTGITIINTAGGGAILQTGTGSGNSGSMTRMRVVSEAEVILVSLCCALLVLFL